jgi:hypothetical protein
VCDYELLIGNEGNEWWWPILKRARIVLETEGNLKRLISEPNFELGNFRYVAMSSGEDLFYTLSIRVLLH